MNKYIPYNPELKEKAREMRNNPTVSEGDNIIPLDKGGWGIIAQY